MSQSIGQSGPQLRPLEGPGSLNGSPPSTQGGSGGMSNIESTSRLTSPPPQLQSGDSPPLTIDGQQRPRSSGHAPPPPLSGSSSTEADYDLLPLSVAQHGEGNAYSLLPLSVAQDSEGNDYSLLHLADAQHGPENRDSIHTLSQALTQGGHVQRESVNDDSSTSSVPVATRPQQPVAKGKAEAQVATPKPLMTRQAFKQSTELKPRFWPHQDRAYKDVLGKIQTFDKFANTHNVSANADDRTAMLKRTMRALDGVEESVKKFANVDGRATGSVKTLLDQIGVTRKAIVTLSADQSIAWDKVNGGRPMTMKQATELVRLGITPGPDTRFEPGHGDTKLKGGLDDYAHGMNNVVARVKYANGDERILKPETGQRGKWTTEFTMGIPQKNPGYAARSLATKLLDDKMGTNLIPKTSLAIHNGELNLSMDVALGRLGSRPWVDQPVTLKLETELRQMKTEVSPERFAQELTNRGVKELAGRNPPSFQFIGKSGAAINPRDPALVKQMNELEWMDCITGQADRHMSNIIVEFGHDGAFVGLKGIDNDTAFGKNWHNMDDVAAQKNGGTNQYRGNGYPSFVDAAFAQKLTHPSFWPDVSARLSKLISPDELRAQKDRYDAAVVKVNELAQNNGVVSNWTAMAATIEADPKNSYAKTFESAQSKFKGVPDPYATSASGVIPTYDQTPVTDDDVDPPADYNNVVPISVPPPPGDDDVDDTIPPPVNNDFYVLRPQN